MSRRKEKHLNHLRQQQRAQEEQQDLELARLIVNAPIPHEKKAPLPYLKPPVQKAPEPNTGGRPSKYDPQYCQMLKDHMAKGYSFETFGAIAGVCRATLYNWLETYPDFKTAKKQAYTLSLHFWESIAIDHINSPKGTKSFHFGLWRFIMQCRFPEIYGDRTIPKPKEAKPETPAVPVRESEIILSSGFRIPI